MATPRPGRSRRALALAVLTAAAVLSAPAVMDAAGAAPRPDPPGSHIIRLNATRRTTTTQKTTTTTSTTIATTTTTAPTTTIATTTTAAPTTTIATTTTAAPSTTIATPTTAPPTTPPLDPFRVAVHEAVYPDISGDGVPVARNDGSTYANQARHDGIPKGVPTSYDWRNGARVYENKDYWASGARYTVMWWHVFVKDGDNATLAGVRAQLRNPRIFQLRPDGTWQVQTPGSGLGGAYYNGAVSVSPRSMTSSEWRSEPSGGYSVSLAALGAPGYDNLHGWYGTWPRFALVQPGSLGMGLVYVAEWRLIDEAGNPVSAPAGKYLANLCGDVFTSADSGGPMNDAGIGRMKDLSGSWTTVGCTNLSASRLAERLAAYPIAYP